MRKKKDEEESDLLELSDMSDIEKKEAELLEREMRVEEEEAKRERKGKGKKVTDGEPPRCPKCNSTQVHIRLRDGAIVCHRCGEVTIPERRVHK